MAINLNKGWRSIWQQTQRLKKKAFVLSYILVLCLSPILAIAQDWAYTTRPGDTLWDISNKYLKNVNYWSRLQQHNSIDIAKKMPPGTRLLIPIAWLKHPPTPATILSISGDVSYVPAKNGKITKLSLDKKTLFAGDKILTGADGSATIKFADGSILLLQKQSELILDTLSSYGATGMIDTKVRLQKGRLETSVKPKKEPGSRYEITTPAAVAAVRGTQFRIEYKLKTEAMLSEVITGKIDVTGAGVHQNISKGYGTITKKGAAPLPPRALLPALDISQLAPKVLHLPYTITWPTLENAAIYRIQVSSEQISPTLLIDELINSTQYTLDKLTDGKYKLVIRGIDDIGLEGFNAQHNFELSTTFPIVELLAPNSSALFYDGKINFKWQKPDQTHRFHLQISSDKTFDTIKIDNIVDEASFAPAEALPPGEYVWRVAGIDAEGNKGAFSPAIVFTVRNLPQAPEINIKTDDVGAKQANFTMRWPAVSEASHYVIQVAKDAEFKNILVNQTTATNQYKPDKPLPYGTYYYRAKSIINTNIQSKYSTIRQFTIEQSNSLVFWLWLLLLPVML
ncbi:MAG: LysM peptidoglycan-binding domain-containing protein [Gammaproteobacteria bacterium]|nr:LysM peptidoglycan-binding domain-containing protein [Gammaproteobacteria bacterium]